MRAFLISLVCAAGLAATACNTVEGVGEDLGAAGRGVERTANEAR